MTLKEIRHKLPQEAQNWLTGMDRGELKCTEVILNNVGEEAFLRQWHQYKQDLQEIRDF